MRRIVLPCALIALLASAPAFADVLAELRTRLAGPPSKEAVRARIEVRSSSESSEDDNVDTSAETVVAELGPEGLRMGWNDAQLAAARAADEAQHRDPNAPRTGAALGEIAPPTVANLLDHAWGLLLTLDGATQVEAALDPSRSVGGTRLGIQLKPVLSAADAKIVKSYEDKLTLWLDQEGWPVASHRAVKVKASKFLMSFGSDSEIERRYARAAGRLVIVHELSKGSGSGLGTESHGTTTTTVTLLP